MYLPLWLFGIFATLALIGFTSLAALAVVYLRVSSLIEDLFADVECNPLCDAPCPYADTQPAADTGPGPTPFH